MQDILDKAILWCLMDEGKTIWEMAKQVMKESGKDLTTHETKKWCDRARYRLDAMIDRGFVKKDRKTRKYSLANVKIGTGEMTIKYDDEEGEDRISMGTTMIAEKNGIVEVILMEEII